MEEEIKGLLWTEIFGQEVMYNQFDTELVQRLMQLGKRSVIIGVILITYYSLINLLIILFVLLETYDFQKISNNKNVIT